MRNAGGLLYALAALTEISGLITGWLLLTHTTQSCAVIYACESTHPFIGAGVAVLIGATLQALVLVIIGYLCDVVADLRSVIEPGPGVTPGSSAPTMYGTRD